MVLQADVREHGVSSCHVHRVYGSEKGKRIGIIDGSKASLFEYNSGPLAYLTFPDSNTSVTEYLKSSPFLFVFVICCQ